MIMLKSRDEIAILRIGNRIAAEILNVLSKEVKVGVTTLELEKIAECEIKKRGAISAFKGYNGYPASICTSVNEVVVHGIPSYRKLEEGDIISLDIGVNYKGYCGDVSETFAVGKINEKKRKLMDVTKKALYLGINEAKDGNRVGDISNAVQTFVESNGFSVVRDFVGHGIGKSVHEEPQVPNFGKKEQGPRLKPGMVLAIEPMVNLGCLDVEILKDGWTAVTKDKLPSAHFEHTVVILEDKTEILTQI
ncbi:MAG: type I methionyl aminopeptidase [Candidatus Firestonebacteria bacterium]